MFSVWVISLIITFIAYTMTQLFKNSLPQSYLPHLAYMFRFILHTIVIISSSLWLSKPYKKSLETVSNKIVIFMSFYLIIGFLLLIHFSELNYEGLATISSNYELTLSILLIVLGYVIVFSSIASSAKSITLQLHYKIAKNQVEFQVQNYQTLNESLNQLYKLKHDVRHHIYTIETLVGQENYLEALEYINQFREYEISHTLPTLCENFVADSIIKHYMSLALSKNINFEANLIIPEDIAINSLDLCVVLGNCLENAIEASDKLNPTIEKSIQLISKLVGTHIVIYISNNYNGEISKIGETIKSSKEGRSHGIGLSSVYETASKYGGNVDIKYTDNLFEVSVIMCTSV